MLCSTALELVSEQWEMLTDTQKNDINGNILYVSDVVCSRNQATVIDQISDEGVFMQVQGRTALCGLCALNNAYQIDLFDVQSLNNIADTLWTRHYSELHMPISELYTPLRDAEGWYSIEVLLQAVQYHGDYMICLNNTLIQFFANREGYIMDALNASQSYPTSLLIRIPEKAHYTTIFCNWDNKFYLLDSMQSMPTEIDEAMLIQYLEDIYYLPTFAVYGFKFNMTAVVRTENKITSFDESDQLCR